MKFYITETSAHKNFTRRLEEVIKPLLYKITVSVAHMGGERYEDGTPVVNVAFYREYGTKYQAPSAEMRTTIKEKQPSWNKLFIIMLRKTGDVEKALKAVGEQAVKDLRGNTDEETGLLARSISYQIDKSRL